MSGSLADRLGAVLAAEAEVVLAYLFGSQARGEAREGSDVDVAVLCARTLSLVELGALAERLGRAVAPSRLDLTDLSTAPPLLRYEVVREGKLLLTRSAEVEERFERMAFLRAMDTKHFRRVQQELLRERSDDGAAR